MRDGAVLARARERVRAEHAADEAASRTGRWLSQRATALMLYPYRAEQIDVPVPIESGEHRFDVVDDLVRFTSLTREQTLALMSRRLENFRVEWLALRPGLRDDTWFYLSSRTYLFANAIHFHDSPELVDEVAALVPRDGRVLEFGGGTGNLSLALAARGLDVDYLELSALQKDFVRFRMGLHGLEDRMSVLDWWASLHSEAYDVVCAFDVFEHVSDLSSTLNRIVPTLAAGGALVESSPFFVSLSNPMHHEDPGFDDLLRAHGLELSKTAPDHRVWRRAAAPAG